MTQAAVLTALGQPLELRHDVDLEAPRAGEVRVKVLATGVCHSDLSMRDGLLPVTLPAVLGHEGSGVVTEVGPGVTSVAPGDHVVISWVPQCGTCFYCSRGQAHLCQEADIALVTGGLLDGTPRFRWREGPVYQMCGCGTFATETVVLATAAVPVPDDLDPAVAALLGCGVVTGVGAALNTATIAEGDAVAVLGCGGVGLNVIQGARIAKAGTILAIDANPSKLAMAEAMGATATVDASRTDPVSAVMTSTAERGADVAFEVVGLGPTIDQAIAMTRRGGQTVLVGLPAIDVMLQLPAWVGLILQHKTIKGCWYGSADLRRDIPRLVDLYRAGDLQVDALVSQRIGLADVNAAFDAMVAGAGARSVIVF